MDLLVHQLHSLVQSQYKSVQRDMTGQGDFVLADSVSLMQTDSKRCCRPSYQMMGVR